MVGNRHNVMYKKARRKMDWKFDRLPVLRTSFWNHGDLIIFVITEDLVRDAIHGLIQFVE